uniref:protein-tyrosine-phosphatase n=1 Tax=Plectus sambesii TaxID=2011161 RepID=A0A914WFK2_9BILA
MAVRPSSFYYNVSGQEAERLLLEYGSENEFLARPSGSNPGDYTLSVRRGTKVTHVKIQNTGDFLDLYGGEMFATLAELVQHYMENPDQLRERDGDIIALKCPVVVPASESLARATVQPITERWFHNSVSGREAEKLLMDQGKNGSYLVRESQSTPGQYAISVRTDDKVTHIMIHNNNGRFDVGGGDTFESINELLEHYSRNPMVERSGMVVHLKTPLPSTRIPAAGIDERIGQLQVSDPLSGKDGFSEEFEKLQQLECNHLYSRKEGKRAENTAKNRYKNILPFDHTRIKLLDAKPGQVGADYINANLIEVLSSDYPEFSGLQRSYISTQGCLPATVDDFWRMVWQQNSRIVVMTTKEFERGRNKCVRYWPDAGTERRYGLKQELLVRNTSEVEAPEYMTRHFEISRLDDKGNPVETRTLYHWQFMAWPDHGCPSNPGSVLNFLEQVNACLENDCPKDAGPSVVHCSAGIGRTGTFIVVDLILNQIKRIGLHCHVDIPRTVQMVREQRSGMVQTELQYRFLYKAVTYHIDTVRKHFDYARQGSGREYTNIKYTMEQAGGQVTPTTPTHNSGHSTDLQPTHAIPIGEPLRLDPPPLPKRLPRPEKQKAYITE